MIEYIAAVKRGLRDRYGFVPKFNGRNPVFNRIPDGTYPMRINGRLDYVRIADNTITCGNFAPRNSENGVLLYHVDEDRNSSSHYQVVISLLGTPFEFRTGSKRQAHNAAKKAATLLGVEPVIT